MCKHIIPLETKTRFIILMHPKEFKRTKNGTGHFTHLSLINSELHIGIDFSKDSHINKIIEDPSTNCYVVYPHKESIDLNNESIEGEEEKENIIFLIDATWPCSKAMLTASPNIDALPKVSFTHSEISAFHFKRQPKSYCLSTIESTLCVLKILNTQGVEVLKAQKLEYFLKPFEEMVKYQLSCNET